MVIKNLQSILFTTLLAFVVNSFVYFGFVNHYSSTLFNHQNFVKQFHSGVYQYRILSTQLLLWIYDVLDHMNIHFDSLKLKFIRSDSDSKMYFSFYLLNTIFLMLTSAVMVLVTSTKTFVATQTEKILLIAVAIFSIVFTQFVIVPYDVSSYFFIVLFLWIFLKYLEGKKNVNLIILGLIMLVSTLNRESSALCISLTASVLFQKYGLKKESLIPIMILTGIFVFTYLGLRIFGESFTTNDGNLFLQNIKQPKNLLGILSWLVFFTFTFILSKKKENKILIILFHILALPYIFICFYTGILYEGRLYLPLFLISLNLSQIKLK